MATMTTTVFMCDWCGTEFPLNVDKAPWVGKASYWTRDVSAQWKDEELCASCAEDLAQLRAKKVKESRT